MEKSQKMSCIHVRYLQDNKITTLEGSIEKFRFLEVLMLHNNSLRDLQSVLDHLVHHRHLKQLSTFLSFLHIFCSLLSLTLSPYQSLLSLSTLLSLSLHLSISSISHCIFPYVLSRFTSKSMCRRREVQRDCPVSPPFARNI